MVKDERLAYTNSASRTAPDWRNPVGPFRRIKTGGIFDDDHNGEAED